MLYVIKWIYMWVLPLGGIVILLAAITAYQCKRRAAGRYPLLAVVVLLYALSIAPTADWLVGSLERVYSQPPLEDVKGDVVILLGGGVRAGVPDFDGTGQISEGAANRFLTAARLQRAFKLPVLLSGGVVFAGDVSESAVARRMLLSLGVDASLIEVDERSRNTAENAAYSREICSRRGWTKPIVVTSAFHMPRAMAFFRREGLDAMPYPCDYRAESGRPFSPYSFIPQAAVLADSCLAIKEYAGLAAVKLGWQ